MPVPREILTAQLDDGSYVVVSPIKPRFCVGGETKEVALEKARLAFAFADRPRAPTHANAHSRMIIDRPAFQSEELVA